MKYVPKIILLLIIGVVVYLLFIRQGYAVHIFSREYPDSFFPAKGYSLRKPLKELVGYKPDLRSPYPEILEKYPYMPSMSYLYRVLDRWPEKKWECDYYSEKIRKPLRSPYFGLLPTEGTYLIGYTYIEIKDDCWSYVTSYINNDYEDNRYFLHTYKLKETSKHKHLADLTDADFDFLSEKFIDKATIETLPFGTYLMKRHYIGDNVVFSIIMSIEKD